MSKILFLLYINFFFFEINALNTNNKNVNKRILKETLEEDINYDEEDIIILHTNDVHCGLTDNIGYDGLMLYKKELQKKYKYILTVDTGDHIQGDTIGVLSKGIDIIDIMNKIGYDVVIIGNHEFDYGIEGLKKCNETLKCGYISSNFCYRKNKTTIFQKYVIKEIGNKRLAFIGILTPQTLSKTKLFKILDENGEMVYDFLAGNEGKDLYDTVQKYIDEINQYKVDYIIILSHLGNEGELNEYTSGELISHINGISAVLDGHSHQIYNITMKDTEGNDIPLAQTGTKLKNIGLLKIKPNGNIISEMISEVPEPENKAEAKKLIRNNKEIWVDKEMNDYIINITESYKDKLNVKIGYSNFDLIINLEQNDKHTQISRSEETSLGNLITDAYKYIGNAEISLISAANIRTDLKKGNITYKNIIDILPFFDEIIVKEVLGQDILNALEYGMKFLPHKSSRFLQVSGISFKVDISINSTVEVDENAMFIKIKGDRRVYDTKIGDKKIDPKKKYRIAFDSYIGNGGDGYSMFIKYDEIYNSLKAGNEVLIIYIQEELNGIIPKIYNNTQGRIIIKSNNNDNKKSNIYIIIIIIMIILVFVIIIIIFYFKRRKKNSKQLLFSENINFNISSLIENN